jgi:hypothetical protein
MVFPAVGDAVIDNATSYWKTSPGLAHMEELPDVPTAEPRYQSRARPSAGC